MLSGLYIKNIAIIKECSIDFSKGLTVLTGETGAGKSIIIDAINLVLGGRFSKDLIRTSCDSATVVAIFSEIDEYLKSKLSDMGIEFDGDELRIFRQVRSNGRSVCKIAEVPVTATMLKEFGVNLISIQGQHDSHELLNPDIHGKYIDNYAQLGDLIVEYQTNFSHLKKIKSEIDKLSLEESQKERKIDLLKYQIEEIEEAQIEIGERELLQKQRAIINESKKIAQATFFAKSAIDGDEDTEGVLSLVESSAEKLEEIGEICPELESIAIRLRDIEYELGDISSELKSFENSNDFSEFNLLEIEDRLDLIYKLSLKYGDSEEDILKTLENSKLELQKIEFSEEKLLELAEEFEKIKSISINLAKEISQKRKIASLEFAQKVKEELKFLSMPNVEFSVLLERVSLNINGCDKISFMVSANLGEEAKALSKIASGGELSRVMLAIKTVLSKGDRIGTMIFDEIDAGISGEAGNKVGKKLKQVSLDRQILCITHLAQIAAMGDNHLFIEKKSTETETFTKVSELENASRIKEIARIISGDAVTELKLKMAKEMMKAN